MPELRIKEVRLPELHLPEMSREDIGRVIGEKTRDIGEKTRDIDLSRFDPRKADLSGLNEISREIQKVDVPKAIKEATTERDRRSRIPFVIGGLLTLGLLVFAVASSPKLRPRLEAAAQKARQRIDEMRAERGMQDEETHAFDAAVAVPIEPSAFSDQAPTAGTPYDGSAELPDGFGAGTADLSPAAEDAVRG
jgi:hypothetical protein